MTIGVPVLDPKRDLKSATSEKLARALLRQPDFRTALRSKAVVRNEVAIQEVPTDEPDDGVPHLDEYV